MVIQKVKITAKDEEELQMRIDDLKLRGFELTSTAEPEFVEHRHYSYTEKRDGIRKNYLGADTQHKHRAEMQRDYKAEGK